ncbi:MULTISPECIES: hypothetical protein [unclassified Streptomyces]|uniref:hypothetical protein n=1 Tax=unclassified Streptomyces TaxID=2593676 RepID=UPI0038043CE4
MELSYWRGEGEVAQNSEKKDAFDDQDAVPVREEQPDDEGADRGEEGGSSGQ